MALKQIPTYSDGTNTVQFLDVPNQKGLLLVMINGVKVACLEDTRPSLKVAEFYLAQEIAKKEAKEEALDEINFEVTQGMFAVRKRRLQTFFVKQNPKTGKFSVYDSQKSGALSGAGFATAEDAFKAYKIHDEHRIRMY